MDNNRRFADTREWTAGKPTAIDGVFEALVAGYYLRGVPIGVNDVVGAVAVEG